MMESLENSEENKVSEDLNTDAPKEMESGEENKQPDQEETKMTDEVVKDSVAEPQANSQTSDHDDELDESEHDDGENEDKEIDEIESAESYADLSRAEMLVLLNELLQETDPGHAKKKFFNVRRAFLQSLRIEKESSFQQFVEDGGNPEEFKFNDDNEFDTVKTLYVNFKTKLTEQRKNREKERESNLMAKQGVIEELKVVIQNEADVLKAFDTVHSLQMKWRSIGVVPFGKSEDLWQSYRFYVGKFYDLIKIHKELQELDQKKNLEHKIELCGQAEDLLIEASIKKVLNAYKLLQEQWKDIGPVPKENNEEIWDRFKSVGDKLFDKRRAHIDGLISLQKENLEKKESLCAMAEQLGTEKSEKPGEWQKLTDQLLELQQQWRKIGPAPKEVNETIWQRFRAAGDVHFNAKKEYFTVLKKEQDANRQLKTDMCVQAESMADSTDWKSTADELKQLQDKWKSVGSVHPRFSQKLWKRFRAACDLFFQNRSAHFAELDKANEENLITKTKLIETIESFSAGDDKTNDIELLKSFQKQWVETGRVPFKAKDKIYQRYKRAIDKCYDTLNISPRERSNESRAYNSHTKPSESDRVLTGKDKSSIRFKIDKLSEEIKLLENNIGFFGHSKGAEQMKAEYQTKIDQAKVELDTLKKLMKQNQNS